MFRNIKRSPQKTKADSSTYIYIHRFHSIFNVHSTFNKVKLLVAHSCLTLCDTMDCRFPGSSVHGILQARILEWVAIPFSSGSSGPGD